MRPGRLAVAWAAFVVAHAISIVLGMFWPNAPMGDTYLVYEPWSDRALAGMGVIGVDEPWVYPPLALAPMLLTQTLVWFDTYQMAWAALVCVLDAAGFWFLVRGGRSRSRVIAGLFWAVFVLLLGPIGLFRIDAVTVPMAVVGLLWLRGRPAVAGAILGAATWIKVWPAALIAAAVIALRGRWRIIAGGFAVSVVVAGTVLAAGGGANLLSFVTEQTGRGLQIEAVAATPFMMGAMTASHIVYYDTDILTYQVTGPGVAATASALNPVMALAAAALVALGVWRTRAGASAIRLLPPLALALVVMLIVTNKVGSPQFEAWLIAPLVWWIVWDRRAAIGPAALGLVIAALTHLVYPALYHHVLAADTLAIALLALRNVLLVALGVWAATRAARVPIPSHD